MKFLEKTKGAISIFLVIILVPMMTVSALFVDASKVSLAQAVATSAGDLALNTALTNYDTNLKDLYGLFATAQDTEDLYAKLEDYYRACIISSGVSSDTAEDYVDQIMGELGIIAEDSQATSDLLNMQLVDFNVFKRSDASLVNPAVLEKQIVDFMKYRAPINTGLSFLSSLKSFATISKQTELVDKRTEYYEEQQSVMENAREAWKYISDYHKLGFSTQYFTDMDSNFAGYEENYPRISKDIVMKLYGSDLLWKNYAAYFPLKEEWLDVEINGTTERVLILYTSTSAPNALVPFYNKTKYSDTKKASSEDIKKAINNLNLCVSNAEIARGKVLPFDVQTYVIQYVMQSYWKRSYEDMDDALTKTYNAFSDLEHAVRYADTDVMTTSVSLTSGGSSKTLTSHYDTAVLAYTTEFGDTLEKMKDLKQLLSASFESYDKYVDKTAAIVDVSAMANSYEKYHTDVTDAITYLTGALEYLGYVLEKVKAGGTLSQKEESWKTSASASELENTPIARQDLAEIDNLSTYLNEADVQNLIDRLSKVKTNFEGMLTQIESYSYYSLNLEFLTCYNDLEYYLESFITEEALHNVPLNTTELENQASEWCDGKFAIGEALDVAWTNDSEQQPDLRSDKLRFFTFLYTHFNSLTEETGEEGTAEEDAAAGEDQYENIKGGASDNAKGNTNSASEGSASTKSENEIKDLSGRPSADGNCGTTPSSDADTGDDAAKNTSSSLSSMFGTLSASVMNMAEDLRDKLYVSDYILSMFSYDTIENEFTVKNEGEALNLQTLTLVPISKDNNYAYGREVEYIIYGQDNTTNVVAAYGSIFGIRLAFNLIYAFTDSSIRDTAFAMATPISAATLGVIPVPLIQGAIIIGIACVESGLDLVDLRNGKEVPLFKTSGTFRCTAQNLIKAAAGEIIKVTAEIVIDEGVRRLGDLIDMTDAELTEVIQGGEDALADYVGDAYDELITRHANTAIQQLTTLANNAVEECLIDPSVDAVEYVSSGLDNWLANEAAGVDTSSDLAYIIKKEAVDLIKSQFIQTILDSIMSSKESASASIEEVAAMLEEPIKLLRENIIELVKTSCAPVMEYKEKMISELKSSMEKGAASLKKTVNEQLDGVFGSSSGTGAVDNTGMASLLWFSYSDYLRLFLMIGLYANHEGIILRTADVIQANMAIQPGNSENYRLSNSAAYVELSATIQVKPTLLALPLFADTEENIMAQTNWYTIQYSNIKGY